MQPQGVMTPRILISDDDPMVVSALSRLARKVGVEVIGDTQSGAHELAKEYQPDLILLDLRQHVDGRDLLAQLKRDETTSHIKVILMSSAEDEWIRRQCLELGAVDFITKPLDVPFYVLVARLCLSPQRATQTMH